jgi:multidrug efflux pump subunit AcrA (membrane-fusion protein)
MLLLLYVSTIFHKNYIVKGVGTIQNSDKTYVSSAVNGEVSQIFKKEGEYVKKGDVILSLKSGPGTADSTEIQKQIDQIDKNIAAIDLYTKSLNEGVNYLKNEGIEQAYYGKAEYYIKKRNDNASLKVKAQKELSNLNSEKKEIENSIKELEKNNAIQQEIDMEKEKIKPKEQEISQKEKEINSYDSQTEETYNQFISEAGTQRNELINKITEFETQKNTSSKNENFYNITASSDGKLSYATPITNGYFIQNGTIVLSISGNENSRLIAKSYISAQERAKIKLNDKVVMNITGLNEYKYGNLNGIIESISSEPIIQKTENREQQIYELVVKLESDEVKDFKLYSGLSLTSNIIYESETYFDYVMEKLSFK